MAKGSKRQRKKLRQQKERERLRRKQQIQTPEIITPEPSVEINRLQELISNNAELFEQANRLWNQLEEAGLDEVSGAVNSALESGKGKFDDYWSIESEAELLNEIARAQNFINDPTSTVKGAQNEYFNVMSELGEQDIFSSSGQAKIGKDVMRDFWYAVDMAREDPNIKAAMALWDSPERQRALMYAYNSFSKIRDSETVRNALWDYVEKKQEIEPIFETEPYQFTKDDFEF